MAALVGAQHHMFRPFSHELHRRRLQIKSRSKIRKNTKDTRGKSQIRHLNISDRGNEAEQSKHSNSDVDLGEKSTHVQQDKTKTMLPSKKLHKLHWGLDTKEPWERKANM
ncbi:uncharacterized protein LOC111006121 isoform X2 [Momordica charantia]|uniref:Uncharacterized protein LOC111006121 isoform X2 n=1 Tax=Momordica charantia TaxID=3673 RepID=A0A6J1BVI4_MOMCH|nr:uncharacterized protein LOC111006121 isoform X2 [Momordica charantia]